LPAIDSDAYFKGYHTFEQRFGQELDTLRRSATQGGENHFYYTGMAQSMLLDRLRPGWKAGAFDQGVWLEDMLEGAD
jgi:hypothetical protein